MHDDLEASEDTQETVAQTKAVAQQHAAAAPAVAAEASAEANTGANMQRTNRAKGGQEKEEPLHQPMGEANVEAVRAAVWWTSYYMSIVAMVAMLASSEPGAESEARELSSAEKSSGWTKLKRGITIDSGAADSVFPASWINQKHVMESKGSRAGVRYVFFS